MTVTTSTRNHVLIHPNNLGPNWYNSFSQYAQTVTDYLDNPDIIALTEIQDNATSSKICSFTHVASGTRCDLRNAAAGNGAEVGVVSSNTNESLKITPKGSGRLKLDATKLPAADGAANYWLQTNGSGSFSFVPRDIVYDTSPTLIANLELSTYSITSSGTDFIQLEAANDIVFKLGDAAGSKKTRIKDSAGTEVVSVDSDGLLTTPTTTVTTANVTTLTISDSTLSVEDVDIAGLDTLTTVDSTDRLLLLDTSASANKTAQVGTLNWEPAAYAFVTSITSGGSTVTGSGISSVVRDGSSVITVNMSPARSSSNYAILLTGYNSGSSKTVGQFDTVTHSTTQFKMYLVNQSGLLGSTEFSVMILEN